MRASRPALWRPGGSPGLRPRPWAADPLGETRLAAAVQGTGRAGRAVGARSRVASMVPETGAASSSSRRASSESAGVRLGGCRSTGGSRRRSRGDVLVLALALIQSRHLPETLSSTRKRSPRRPVDAGHHLAILSGLVERAADPLPRYPLLRSVLPSVPLLGVTSRLGAV
jgi:hypothetical protein